MKRFFLCVLLSLACACGKSESSSSKPGPGPGEREVYELPAPFTVGPEAFDKDGGHIQGIAASDDALYLAQATMLSRVKWDGTLLASKVVTRHLGDLCWYDGELFGAYALGSVGKIVVFDKQLSVKREVEINHPVDGITCLDGILYVGMGSKTDPSSEPHRVNVLGRFDAKTLEEIAPRADFDYGYETRYGFQDMSTDGKNIYAAFYVANSSSPQLVVFDKDLKIVRMSHLDFTISNGFDLMPEKFRGKDVVFVKSASTQTTTKVTCSLSYWYPFSL